MLGIDLGHAVPSLALESSLNLLSEVGGEGMEAQTESLRLLTVFSALVKREYSTSLETDPYPGGGLGRWSTLEVLSALGAWTALQSVTGEEWGKKIGKELEEVDPKSWRGESVQEREEEKVAEVIWEIRENDLEDEVEVVSGVVEKGVDQTETTLNATLNRTEEALTRAHLRRFSKMALGSYGGLGVIAFGELPRSYPFCCNSKILTWMYATGVKLPPSATSLLPDPPVAAQTSSDGEGTSPGSFSPSTPKESSSSFSFWNLLRGTQYVVFFPQAIVPKC